MNPYLAFLQSQPPSVRQSAPQFANVGGQIMPKQIAPQFQLLNKMPQGQGGGWNPYLAALQMKIGVQKPQQEEKPTTPMTGQTPNPNNSTNNYGLAGRNALFQTIGQNFSPQQSQALRPVTDQYNNTMLPTNQINPNAPQVLRGATSEKGDFI